MVVMLRKICINISDKSLTKIRFADNGSKKNKINFKSRLTKIARK